MHHVWHQDTLWNYSHGSSEWEGVLETREPEIWQEVASGWQAPVAWWLYMAKLYTVLLNFTTYPQSTWMGGSGYGKLSISILQDESELICWGK
jgi:hypothetical protein